MLYVAPKCVQHSAYVAANVQHDFVCKVEVQVRQALFIVALAFERLAFDSYGVVAGVEIASRVSAVGARLGVIDYPDSFFC